jgi:membrane protein DedA with SNARE-associated domain
MHSLLLSITDYSYFEIFTALGLVIVGLPIPDETLMAYAGFLVFQGKPTYLYTIMVVFMGTTCGITIGYALGRTFGNVVHGIPRRSQTLDDERGDLGVIFDQ